MRSVLSRTAALQRAPLKHAARRQEETVTVMAHDVSGDTHRPHVPSFRPPTPRSGGSMETVTPFADWTAQGPQADPAQDHSFPEWQVRSGPRPRPRGLSQRTRPSQLWRRGCPLSGKVITLARTLACRFPQDPRLGGGPWGSQTRGRPGPVHPHRQGTSVSKRKALLSECSLLVTSPR